MQRLILKISIEGKEPHEEIYEIQDGVNAEKWAKNLVENFNSTRVLRKEKKLVSVKTEKIQKEKTAVKMKKEKATIKMKKEDIQIFDIYKDERVILFYWTCDYFGFGRVGIYANTFEVYDDDGLSDEHCQMIIELGFKKMAE